MSQPASWMNMLLLLCEQTGRLMSRPHKPEYYIAPVIDWMSNEWQRVKPLIVNTVVHILSKKSPKLEAAEEFLLSKPRRRTVLGAISSLMHKYQSESKQRMSDALKAARADTVPKLGVEGVSISLSAEGMAEVVAAFEFQKEFVDNLELDVVTRIEKVLEGRYGAVSDIRTQLTREFRIDRDIGLGSFHDEVDAIARKLMDGRITPARFQEQMENAIGKQYRSLYRQGKGSPLEAWDEEFIQRQVQTQQPYLTNFSNYIQQKSALGEELTGGIAQRAGLYAERGSALFEAGYTASLPDDVLIDWVMQPAEHCYMCPILAANSPYTKASLPSYPGDGSTPCITNCKCYLRVSDLYVSEVI